MCAMSGGWKSRRGPSVFAAVTTAVVVAVAVSYATRGHSTPFSHRAVGPHIPVASAGSATIAAVRQVADLPCAARSDVGDIETHKCYEVIGRPIARADDVQMALVRDDEACWCIDLVLRDAATARLDRFIRDAPATELLAIRFGSTAVALPTSRQPLRGSITISDANWTRIDAQRVVDALSGPRTSHDYAAGFKIPPNLLPGGTVVTVSPAP